MTDIKALMSKIKSIKMTEKDRIIEEKDRIIEEYQNKGFQNMMEGMREQLYVELEDIILRQAEEIKTLKKKLETCTPLSQALSMIACVSPLVVLGIVFIVGMLSW